VLLQTRAALFNDELASATLKTLNYSLFVTALDRDASSCATV